MLLLMVMVCCHIDGLLCWGCCGKGVPSRAGFLAVLLLRAAGCAETGPLRLLLKPCKGAAAQTRQGKLKTKQLSWRCLLLLLCVPAEQSPLLPVPMEIWCVEMSVGLLKTTAKDVAGRESQCSRQKRFPCCTEEQREGASVCWHRMKGTSVIVDCGLCGGEGGAFSFAVFVLGVLCPNTERMQERPTPSHFDCHQSVHASNEGPLGGRVRCWISCPEFCQEAQEACKVCNNTLRAVP